MDFSEDTMDKMTCIEVKSRFDSVAGVNELLGSLKLSFLASRAGDQVDGFIDIRDGTVCIYLSKKPEQDLVDQIRRALSD